MKTVGKFLRIIIILATIVCISYVVFCIATSPQICPSKIYDNIEQSSILYDDSGNEIDTIYYSQNRNLVEYENIPENLINAFVAIEDKTFWTHHGLNFKRMVKAILNGLTGSTINGTSTITQQLARNIYLTDTMSQRTIKRKIVEIWYAILIEHALSKESIMEAYLNTIYFGDGCYGIDAAAHHYFSKNVDQLTLEESAILAALPQAPEEYAPVKSEYEEGYVDLGNGLYGNSACQERRDLVLSLMVEQGYIEQSDADGVKRPILEIINPSPITTQKSSYFKDYVISQVSADLVKEYDLTEAEAEKMIYTGGLKIYSTLNSNAQAIAEAEFADSSNFPSSESEVQGSMVVTEVGTGAIKVMVGGRNATGQKLFNRAISPRQPGSSIKPLSVYSAALQKSYEYSMNGEKFPFIYHDHGLQSGYGWGDYITASSKVTDERMYFEGKVWPVNAGGYFSGYKTFRTALQRSLNTCAVKIGLQVGTDYSIEMLKKYGISTLEEDGESTDNQIGAMALGGMVHGITPLDMALAYATFPNGGVRNSAICYTEVQASDGSVLLKGKSKETEVLNEGVAWIMTDVLKTCVSRGIASAADINGVQVGGKTGTTNDECDRWFVGFTPSYSAAIWIGTDDHKQLKSWNNPAASLWSEIMDQIPEFKTGEYKEMPSNVIKQNGEYYTKGTEP